MRNSRRPPDTPAHAAPYPALEARESRSGEVNEMLKRGLPWDVSTAEAFVVTNFQR
jgi:hypothetical protein